MCYFGYLIYRLIQMNDYFIHLEFQDFINLMLVLFIHGFDKNLFREVQNVIFNVKIWFYFKQDV